MRIRPLDLVVRRLVSWEVLDDMMSEAADASVFQKHRLELCFTRLTSASQSTARLSKATPEHCSSTSLRQTAVDFKAEKARPAVSVFKLCHSEFVPWLLQSTAYKRSTRDQWCSGGWRWRWQWQCCRQFSGWDLCQYWWACCLRHHVVKYFSRHQQSHHKVQWTYPCQMQCG